MNSRRLIFLVWAPQGVSRALSSATSTALSLLLFDRTHSVLVMSSIVSCSLLASIYVSPLVGGFVDRFQKRYVLIVCGLVQAALMMALGLAAVPAEPQLASLFAIIIVSGALDAGITITLLAAVADITEDASLVKANAFITLIQNAPVILGPAIGAALYSVASFSVVICLDVVSFALAAAAATSLPLLEKETPSAGVSWVRLPFSGARAGMGLLFHHPAMRTSQLLYSLSNFGNGLAAGLLSVYILTTAIRPRGALGAFGTASSLGMVLTAIVLGWVGIPGRQSRLVIVGLLGAAVLGRLTLLWATSLVAIAAVGMARAMFIEASNAPLLAIWQHATPKAVRGRIFGARRLMAQAPYPFAVWLGGVVVERMTSGAGIREVAAIRGVIVAGVAVEVLSALSMSLSGCLNRLESEG